MPTEQIIHVQRDQQGQWTAWFQDAPATASDGGSAFDAVARLIDSVPQKISLPAFWPLSDEDSGSFEIAVIASYRCPECGGSGKYVGLNSVEPCDLCGGRGELRLQQVTHE